MPNWFNYDDPDELEAYLNHLADEQLREAAGGGGDDTNDDHERGDPDAPAAPAAPAIDGLWHAKDAAAIFGAPYTEPPFLIPSLEIGPGRPIGIIGAPGAGKNDTAQTIALAVATGTDAFGLFEVARRGRVVHLTWDMGDWPTRLRYRRLAAGMGLTLGDLEGWLTLCPYPDMNLAHKDAAKTFTKLLRGFDLAILDNAREAAPGVDENDSKFGSYIATFGRAAEATGCTPLYLHHAKKGGAAGIESIRGSGAITGASGCIWYLDGSGTDPRRLSHIRPHDISDGIKPDCWLTQVAGGDPGAFDCGTHQPMRLVGSLTAPAKAGGGDAGSVRQAVLTALKGRPGMTVAALKSCVPGRAERVVAAITALLANGEIEDRGGPNGGKSLYRTDSDV